MSPGRAAAVFAWLWWIPGCNILTSDLSFDVAVGSAGGSGGQRNDSAGGSGGSNAQGGQGEAGGPRNNGGSAGTGPVGGSGSDGGGGSAAGPTGDRLWPDSVGSIPGIGYNVTFDPADGSVVVTGELTGTQYFQKAPLTTKGSRDALVCKYTANGKEVWCTAFGSAGTAEGDDETGRSVAVDSHGDVIVVGTVKGSVDFGGGERTAFGKKDMFVAKLASKTGEHMWSAIYGTAENDENGSSVAVDSEDNVIVASEVVSALSLGGPVLDGFSGIGQKIGLAKYSSTGQHVWSKVFAASYYCRIYSIAITSDDNVVLGGIVYGSLSFGDEVPISSSLFADGLVAKLSGEDASHIWSTAFGGEDQDQILGVAVGPNDTVAAIGQFASTSATVGEDTSNPLTFENKGNFDLILVELKSDGSIERANGFGTPDWDISAGIGLDSHGNLILAGNSNTGGPGMDFGSGPVERGPFIVKFDTERNVLWSKGSPEVSLNAQMTGVAIGPGDRIAVGGHNGAAAITMYAP